jgi:signal transduction histidine kinase
MSGGPPGHQRRSSGLFRRIYATFVVTVLASALGVGVGAYLLARSLSADWVGDTLQHLADRNDDLVASLHDPQVFATILAQVEDDLNQTLTVYDARGDRIAGDGPITMPGPRHRLSRHLRGGRPFVRQRNRFRPPLVLVPLMDPVSDHTIAVVHVRPPTRTPAGPLLASIGLVLGALGLGAWALSRSLTSRLADLERSADRIATGELGHRVDVPIKTRDELDELGHAFNEMGRKVQALVVGQQTLLTNVSHELRTPMARMKVLVEILQERADALRADADAASASHIERLREGLAEMAVDSDELEELVSDLLTSGRLELRAGEGGPLERAPVHLAEPATKIGERHGARVSVPEDLVVSADALLIERLLSNLVSNARRACPEGEVELSAQTQEDTVLIVVQDEGPGVAAEHRETIFEPFTRLDDARSRDRGGVGLGLHLCRQICAAHEGTIEVRDRIDDRPGARFEVRLPAP